MQKLHLTSHLPQADLANKRVFLRADLNVPVDTIRTGITDHRLTAIVPTIDLILQKGGKIILATHIGRPQKPTAQLSTEKLVPWFKDHGYAVVYEPDFHKAYELSREHNKTIVLLENLRFFPGEKNGDTHFAQQLAHLADWYVNDAFALLHRTDTSITLLPELFPKNQRTIGLLIVKELTMLNKLLDNPQKPFVLGLGGGKVTDKIPLIEHLLPHLQTILLCPAIVFTFLKALGKPVGRSLVDDHAQEVVLNILEKAKKNKVKIVFPIDYQVAQKKFTGPLSIVDAYNFPQDAVGISIGPHTAHLFAQEIREAATIFYNGAMGDINRPETLQGLAGIFKAMGESKGLSVIGGGESVAAAHILGMSQNIRYISTGGGATLAYLSGQPLPGLALFLNN